MNDVSASRALGWASIGIGLTEIAATDWLQAQLGVDPDDQHLLDRALVLDAAVLRRAHLCQLGELRGVDDLLAQQPRERVAGDRPPGLDDLLR